MNYSDRLKACKLLTLHYRRIRGDMIKTYKIMTGKYDIDIAPSLVAKKLSPVRTGLVAKSYYQSGNVRYSTAASCTCALHAVHAHC